MVKSNVRINIPVDGKQKGIWAFHRYLNPVPENDRITLGEGGTEEINCEDLDVIFKREDQNPTGSLKDRGMAFLLSKLISEGKKNFSISSSGNAAISAAEYCKLSGLNLKIFISPKTEEEKLNKIKSYGFEIETTTRPVSGSARFAVKNGYVNLRPSTLPGGTEGYKTIAFELLIHYGKIDDIFIPVSSGCCFTGIYEGFAKFGLLPRFHLCQSSAVNPVAKIFDKDFIKEKDSLASALIAKSLFLKKSIIEAIKTSAGTGWVISNQEIKNAQSILEKQNIITSNEGALSLAAILKARKKGYKLGKTVCLLTGKKYGN